MVKSIILLVEDNESIHFNLKLLLEFNNFKVISAFNGNEAINYLNSAEKVPDLILSDILMPEKNGYELLEKISTNSKWNMIPFIFLSAKSTPEDVKLGKLLGADDYITKPVDEELLIGLITKKITKAHQLEESIKSKYESENIEKMKHLFEDSNNNIDKSAIWFFLVEWDENQGPIVTKKLHELNKFEIDLESLGVQLFQTTVALFGNQGTISTEAVLLNVTNINLKAFIVFDAIVDETIRGGQRQIMITVLAPEISYFDSLKLKNILFSLASDLKYEDKNNFEWYYSAVQSILAQ